MFKHLTRQRPKPKGEKAPFCCWPVEIDEAGDVSYIEVASIPAGADFDAAATEAAWEFVFSPAEDESGPVPVAIEFEYGFVLDASSVEGAVEDDTEEIERPSISTAWSKRWAPSVTEGCLGTPHTRRWNHFGNDHDRRRHYLEVFPKGWSNFKPYFLIMERHPNRWRSRTQS